MILDPDLESSKRQVARRQPPAAYGGGEAGVSRMVRRHLTIRYVHNTFSIILLLIFPFARIQTDTQTCTSQYFDSERPGLSCSVVCVMLRLAVRTDGRTSDRYFTATHGRCTIEIHDHAHKFGKDRTFGSRDMPSISDW